MKTDCTNSMDYIEVIEKVRAQTEKMVKKSRYEHSVRVAEMCARLCRYFGINQDKGYLAGIGHDMCKDLPDEEMIFWAKKDLQPVSDFEMKKISYLHGRASAMMLKEQFGIEDEEILEAVANHTSGKIDMCDLTKCLLISDKAEPGRPQSTDEYREKLYKMSLDEMTYFILEENYEYVKRKGYEIYPATQQIIKQIKALVD